MLKNLLLIMFSIFLLVVNVNFAEAKSVPSEEALTKGEAISLISATDFIRKKIGDLLSWTVGYDIRKINRVKLVPSIKYVRAMPRRIPPDGRTVLDLYAEIEDPEGLNNISGVKADLSTIGKLQNSILVDTGLWGDKTANDGVYSLQSNVESNITLGDKEISVAVVNKKGWMALSRTIVMVESQPVISEFYIEPQKIKLSANATIKINAKIENPGREEDLRNVEVDLSEIGQGKKVPLQYKGNDRFFLETTVPLFVKPGNKKIRLFSENNQGKTAESETNIEVIP